MYIFFKFHVIMRECVRIFYIFICNYTRVRTHTFIHEYDLFLTIS